MDLLKSFLWSLLASVAVNILYVIFKIVKSERQLGNEDSVGILVSFWGFLFYTLVLALIITMISVGVMVLLHRS